MVLMYNEGFKSSLDTAKIYILRLRTVGSFYVFKSRVIYFISLEFLLKLVNMFLSFLPSENL